MPAPVGFVPPKIAKVAGEEMFHGALRIGFVPVLFGPSPSCGRKSLLPVWFGLTLRLPSAFARMLS